jgi:hypothetical protein
MSLIEIFRMKKIRPNRIVLFISVICMVSCSTNGFFVKKNHQPRIRIEAQPGFGNTDAIPMEHSMNAETEDECLESSIQTETAPKSEIKPNFFYKTLSTFYPCQRKILKKVYEHPSHHLGYAAPKEGGDRTTGLIINLLALAFGIAAILMVIGVAHGNLWVYFVVGLILAAAAIIMGFIGKGMAWRGFGWLAGIIGIVAVVLLLIFMVLVAVVHTTF